MQDYKSEVKGTSYTLHMSLNGSEVKHSTLQIQYSFC